MSCDRRGRSGRKSSRRNRKQPEGSADPEEEPVSATVRIRPVPRSEPLTDEELRTVGRTLPVDLATGVRVRGGDRSSGDRSGGGGARRRGAVVGTSTTASDAVPPAQPAAPAATPK